MDHDLEVVDEEAANGDGVTGRLQGLGVAQQPQPSFMDRAETRLNYLLVPEEAQGDQAVPFVGDGQTSLRQRIDGAEGQSNALLLVQVLHDICAEGTPEVGRRPPE